MSGDEFRKLVNLQRSKGGETAKAKPITRTQSQRVKSRQFQRNAGLPRAEVVGAKFSLLTARGIEEISVCHITKPSHQSGRDQAADATPLDQRMGNIDYRLSCVTCGKSAENCEGHYGSIPLNINGTTQYIYSPLYKKLTEYILKVTCLNCHNVLLSREMFNFLKVGHYKGEARLKFLVDTIKRGGCPHCGHINPELNFKNFKDENKIKSKMRDVETLIEAHQVFDHFNQMTPETIRQLGFNKNSHPASFIFTSMVAIPMSARPPTYISAGTSQPDAITKKYSDIVVASIKEPANGTRYQAMYDFIEELFENRNKDKKGAIKGRANDSIKEMIDGKDGIIRGKMMGKRKNNTVRTVLAPGIKLRFGEVGVPEKTKEFVLKRETVTVATYNLYQRMFGNSFEECKIRHVIYNTGPQQGLVCKVNANSWQNHKDKVAPGTQVDRELQDGDVMLFNRQPTLGADSMMGYTIKFTPSMTLRVHLCDTSKLNADFDGDEGNGHFPQTDGMAIELATFAHAANRIISERNNAPTIGVVFNGPSAIYMLSNDAMRLSPETWMAGYLESEQCQGAPTSDTFANFLDRLAQHGIDRYSGKALISSLFPADFFYHKDEVSIKNGIFVSGIMTKAHVGRSANSLIQSMYKQYGNVRTADFVTQIYFLLDWFIPVKGLSVSYNDCALNETAYDNLVKVRSAAIEKAQQKVYETAEEFSRNTMAEQHVESQTLEFIGQIRSAVAKTLSEQVDTNNPMNIMIGSGAKGSDINTGQILGSIGQQLLAGRRPVPVLSHGKRCLPHFTMNSKKIQARGFCEHSFGEGLDPTELFFHAEGSRLGLMDTGTKVSETGSLQRRMMKVMEDTYISVNGAVVNTSGSVFSAIDYDGMDPTQLVNVKTKNGPLTSFVNFDEVINKINSKYT